MTPLTSPARVILVTTLLLALFGNLLLRADPWGLNFTAVTFSLFAALVFLSRRLDVPLPMDAWPIALLGILTATCVLWRDSATLTAANILASLGALGMVTARRAPARLLHMTFFDHLRRTGVQAAHVAAGAGILLLSDLRGTTTETEGQASAWRPVWIGIILAVPLLLLFGALLTSADATFEFLIRDVLHINFWTFLGHASIIALLAWPIGGWLRGHYLGTESSRPVTFLPDRPSLGLTEIAILLGSLDVLFGTFVILQLPHFFGSHAVLLGTPDLTYAQYARRGFFELIVVAVLTLTLLLAADWLYQGTRTRDRAIIRTLSVVMIALVGVMLASALHRLALYIDAYGLTTTRINAAAILVWTALSLLLFFPTVLRGRRHVLPYAMAVAGFITLLGLNVLDPDAVIARVNIARWEAVGKFDRHYTLSLSADAAPVLLQSLSTLSPEHRGAFADRLLRTYLPEDGGQDFRTWNAARARATSLVATRQGELRSYVLPPPPPEMPIH